VDSQALVALSDARHTGSRIENIVGAQKAESDFLPPAPLVIGERGSRLNQSTAKGGNRGGSFQTEK
jgi:hypothetical protein